MNRKTAHALDQIISGRSAPGGGFCEQSGSFFRVDSTAWAILALKAVDTNPDLLNSARSRLAFGQQQDGRVCFTKDQPHVFWPTALAILAWHGSEENREHRELAIQFILHAVSSHWKKNENSPVSLDTSLRGWPWTEDSFAWIEPTSLSILALSLNGYDNHERVQEAVRLLLDRQLASGGWNYGNTIVYGQELYPQPESTGMALAALAGRVERRFIERGLDYLRLQASLLRTPLSLGWALFGLGAWGQRPSQAKKWIIESLSRQRKYGPYGTTLLSLLLLAYTSKDGLLETIA